MGEMDEMGCGIMELGLHYRILNAFNDLSIFWMS